MTTNWISRLAQELAGLFSSPDWDGLYVDGDADSRRMRSDLDAIRVRFPDHA
ncbi:hypothetical protein [Mycobacterium sp.]|jgi:hypothetical protein|uniref:hypothetical protein n=1 Tax=Mycobacterium sp. TaxID=1785 RepID=UPI002DB04E26|nr:hypothetical protein [Mycobacterium sp.]